MSSNSLTGAPSTKKNIPEVEREAKHAYDAGDFARALQALVKVKDLHGKDVEGNGEKKRLPICGSDAASAKEYAIMESCLHSNIGVVCRGLGQTSIADKHFARAIEANSRTKDPASNKRYCILQFNRGLSYLSAGRGREALACLEDACHAFSDRPALWLRLAEACVAERERCKWISAERLEYAWGELTRIEGVQPEMGSVDGVQRTFYADNFDEDETICYLPRASLFARHALRLEREGLTPRAEETNSHRQRHYYSDIAAGSILLLSYVHLELHDVAVALEWAELLLSWPRCRAATDERIDLARVYATEARAALGYGICERDGVACRESFTLPPAEFNDATLISLIDHHDSSAAWDHASTGSKADRGRRLTVRTAGWMLLNKGRFGEAEQFLGNRLD